MKILIVDDDRFIHEYIKTALGDEDCILSSVYSYNEAIEILDKEQFDLVITDILMPPGNDGTKLAQYVKENYPGIPVIVMTAGLENAVKDYVIWGGFYGDISMEKPLAVQELIENINSLTGKL
jgi:DNA-binding NtrC family response regulator